LTFLDRAQGVTLYGKSTLINIDRLAQDDYKGVGESYSYQRKNLFNMKFAIISKGDDLERLWQRNYDEALVGYIV
jgi:hypothetical protein